jgi:mono/diheme cytochrome c family protein
MCAGALGAQDGAILFKTKCAQCHDPPVGRIPTVSALRAMTRSAILNALDNGSMKAQSAGLSEAQRQGIAEYLASSGSEAATNACAGGSAVARKILSGQTGEPIRQTRVFRMPRMVAN